MRLRPCGGAGPRARQPSGPGREGRDGNAAGDSEARAGRDGAGAQRPLPTTGARPLPVIAESLPPRGPPGPARRLRTTGRGGGCPRSPRRPGNPPPPSPPARAARLRVAPRGRAAAPSRRGPIVADTSSALLAAGPAALIAAGRRSQAGGGHRRRAGGRTTNSTSRPTRPRRAESDPAGVDADAHTRAASPRARDAAAVPHCNIQRAASVRPWVRGAASRSRPRPRSPPD